MSGHVWLSPAEFAALPDVGRSQATVTRLLREGKLRGRRIGPTGGRWQVLASERKRLHGKRD